MKFLYSPPSPDDLIRLLKAWRFWVFGAILGAVLGWVMFNVVPPPYRAQATVVVDFNLEEAWPEDTDRQQFYYLERESRKLEEIAWSDDLLASLASEFSISMTDLRGEKLQLSQPAEGGWHFYAVDSNEETANRLASAWAMAFAESVAKHVARSHGLNTFIEVQVTQTVDLPVERSLPLSTYILIGAVGFLSISAFLFLFVSKPK